MTPDEKILEPLGGEDNLRLMCDADNFIYYSGGEARFSIKNHRVCITRRVYFDETPRWMLEVYDAPFLHRSFFEGALEGKSLERAFTIATGYTLRF